MIELTGQILAILFPAAALAVIGVVWAKSGHDFPIKFVTTLVINLGMPALLFHTLVTSEVEITSLGNMLWATLVLHVLMTPAAVLLLKHFGKDWRLSIALVVGNTGNLGLPVCYFAFGDIGLAYAMAYFAVQCLLLFSLGEAIVAGSASIKPALKSPILHSLWLAALVMYFDFAMPKVVLDTTSLLGQLVIPIMLITLGVSLAGLKVDRMRSTIIWSMLRTGLALAFGFGVAAMMGLEGVPRAVLILETIMPVAVFNFLLAVRHNRDTHSGYAFIGHHLFADCSRVSTLVVLCYRCSRVITGT